MPRHACPRAPGIAIDESAWCSPAMTAARTADLVFDGTPVRRLGEPGTYLDRPGFWHGGAGIAACWLGAVVPFVLAPRALVARRAERHAAAQAVERARGLAQGQLRFDRRHEFAYYLPDAAVETMADCVRRTLAPCGLLLLACHWRHPFAERLIAPERAHELLGQHAGLDCITTHVEAVLMQALTRDGRSVAAREGIA